jgi:hypothetical protein
MPFVISSLMTSSGTSDSSTELRWRLWQDWVVALFLFIASAAVVVWQNSRVGVLWDLSYVLENSYRISLGNILYRDFPFPHAPLTFLIQAALIKLTGRVFWHHVVYCAVASGLATMLTWRIVLHLLQGANARLLACLLSLPLIVLGIYCIFPHPFYDPDCSLAILLSLLLLLLQLERKGISSLRAFLTGTTLVIPLFVKQNTGLAFLASSGLALVVLMVIEARCRRSVRGHACVLAGAAAGLALSLLLIQLTVGLHNYWYWTIQFAAERRTPARGDMLGIYTDKTLLFWIAMFVAGALLLWFTRRESRVLRMLSGLIMSMPFAWPAIFLLRDQDASERAERLLALWPALLIASFIVAILNIKIRHHVLLVLPFILIGTINGAFLSQQLWGSTYAIWPLFMILIATMIVSLRQLAVDGFAWMAVPMTTVIVASLLISGASYVRSEERLDYANLSDGEMTRSTLPQLKGLSIRGQWIPDFEELVRYSNTQIPPDDAVLAIPGEDLFFYTTGRTPRFPVQLFDRTTNPYSPEEIIKLCRDRNIRWVIVKQDLQLDDERVEQDKDRLTELLDEDFEQVESLNNYDIYRRNDSPETSSSSEPSGPDRAK